MMRNDYQKCTIAVIIFMFALIPCFGYAQTAEEVVERSYEKMQGESSEAVITMKIIRPDWERSYTMKTWSKGEDLSMILIQAPARDNGTAFLLRENEIWNWLPNVNRTIKMPPSMMSQSWMGSDFSNNDLVREATIIKDYSYRMIGDTTLNGYDSYIIEMIPKPEAPVVWSRVVSYITKEDYLYLRADYFDEDDLPVRRMLAYDIKEMGGRVIPSKMEMIPLGEEDRKTLVIYEEIIFNADISDRFFSLQNLKRLN